MDVKAIAEDIAALNRALDFEGAAKYWSPDVVSIEPQEGPHSLCRGLEEMQAKNDWFASVATIHAMEVDGPYIHGNQFALRFVMDMTHAEFGRITMPEVGLYTLKDGKVVEERFFY